MEDAPTSVVALVGLTPLWPGSRGIVTAIVFEPVMPFRFVVDPVSWPLLFGCLRFGVRPVWQSSEHNLPGSFFPPLPKRTRWPLRNVPRLLLPTGMQVCVEVTNPTEEPLLVRAGLLVVALDVAGEEVEQ